METAINVVILIVGIAVIVFFVLCIMALMKVASEDEWEELHGKRTARRGSESIRVHGGDASSDNMGEDTLHSVQDSAEESH